MIFLFLTGKDLPQSQTVRDLLRVVTLCNRAHFKPDQPDGPIYAKTVVGDASESALLKFIEAVDGHTDEIRANHVPAVEIPFNSTTKFQVTKNWLCLDMIGLLMTKNQSEKNYSSKLFPSQIMENFPQNGNFFRPKNGNFFRPKNGNFFRPKNGNFFLSHKMETSFCPTKWKLLFVPQNGNFFLFQKMETFFVPKNGNFFCSKKWKLFLFQKMETFFVPKNGNFFCSKKWKLFLFQKMEISFCPTKWKLLFVQ